MTKTSGASPKPPLDTGRLTEIRNLAADSIALSAFVDPGDVAKLAHAALDVCDAYEQVLQGNSQAEAQLTHISSGASSKPLSAADRELLDAMSRGGYVSLATRRAVIDLVDSVAALQAQVDALTRQLELAAASEQGETPS